MKGLRKRLQEAANKGFSFVELIVAVAILATVSTTVGGILVVSANTYKDGNNEVEMQQEAQLIVNQIADMIIDTTFEDDQGVTFTGNTLTILQNGDTHNVIFDSAAKTLSYRCDYAGGATSETQLMAEGIYSFYADVSSFSNSGNLYLDIGVERDNKQFDAAFTVTSRNGIVHTEPIVSIDVVSDVVLEPNEVYQFTPVVNGISNQNVTWEIVSGSTDTETKMLSDNKIEIGKDEYGSDIFLLCKTQAVDGSGAPLAIKSVKVRIRRVTGVNVSGYLYSGDACKNGAVYKGTIVLQGTYLDQEVGQDYDLNYVSPYTISNSLSSTGITTAPVYSVSQDGSSLNRWNFTITLQEDMEAGDKVILKSVANHPLGSIGEVATNKTGESYDNVSGQYTIQLSRFIMSDMERGSDLEFGRYSFFDIKQQLAALYGCSDGEFTLKRKYRFRKASSTSDADWSEWYQGLGDQGESINVRPEFGCKMDCHYRYTIQIKMYVERRGVEVWPIEGETPKEDYLYEGTVEAAGVSFNSSALGFTKEFGWSKSEAVSSPKIDKNVTNFEIMTLPPAETINGRVYRGWRAMKQENYENKLCYVLEKQDGVNWVPVEGGIAQQMTPICRIAHLDGAGIYRIKVSMDTTGMGVQTTNPAIFNFYEVGGDEGYFYFEAQ